MAVDLLNVIPSIGYFSVSFCLDTGIKDCNGNSIKKVLSARMQNDFARQVLKNEQVRHDVEEEIKKYVSCLIDDIEDSGDFGASASSGSAKSLSGYVYILRVSGQNLFKVGMTTGVKKRLGSILTASPYDVKEVRTYRVKNRLGVEKLAHKKLADHRVKREWFCCSEDTVISAVESAIAEIC